MQAMPFHRQAPVVEDEGELLANGRRSAQWLYSQWLKEDSGDPDDALLHPPKTYRAVFLSDTHIGTPVCRAAELVRFLNHCQADYLYWNGDIVDLWHLRIFSPARMGKLLNSESFGRAQLTLIQKILREDRRGSRQIFIPGNHDEAVRALIGTGVRFGNQMLFLHDAVHETVTGERFLVMHGDSFDTIVRNHRWLGVLGTHVFGWLVGLSQTIDRLRGRVAAFNRLLERFGLDRHWSLAHQIKAKADGAAYNESYQRAMLTFMFRENANLAKRNAPAFSGIVCGHTHVAACKRFASPLNPVTGQSLGPRFIRYFNTGHWTGRPAVDGQDLPSPSDGEAPSCTALVEQSDGHMELVRWDALKGIVPVTEG